MDERSGGAGVVAALHLRVLAGRGRDPLRASGAGSAGRGGSGTPGDRAVAANISFVS